MVGLVVDDQTLRACVGSEEAGSEWEGRVGAFSFCGGGGCVGGRVGAAGEGWGLVDMIYCTRTAAYLKTAENKDRSVDMMVFFRFSKAAGINHNIYPLFFAFLPLLPVLSTPVACVSPSEAAAMVLAGGPGAARSSRSSRPAFFKSTSPIASTLLAIHCWKGLATKYPSAVNQVVKGVLSCLVLGEGEEGEEVATSR